MQVPTIAIADSDQPKGYRLINESDFNPEVHKRYEGKQPVPLAAEAPTELEPYVPKPTVQPSDRLDGLTLTQLRGLAQTEEIKGRTGMDQEELIQALEKKGYKRTTSEL
jgi:hypothetical protein